MSAVIRSWLCLGMMLICYLWTYVFICISYSEILLFLLFWISRISFFFFFGNWAEKWIFIFSAFKNVLNWAYKDVWTSLYIMQTLTSWNPQSQIHWNNKIYFGFKVFLETKSVIIFDQIHIFQRFLQTFRQLLTSNFRLYALDQCALVSCSDLHTCLLSSAWGLHECVVLASRLPGSPRPPLPDRPWCYWPAKAEPDVPAGAGAAPPAKAEPAAAGQLQDAAAAAGLLHARGCAVAGPPLYHSAAPHWGAPVWGVDDAVWR